MYYSFTSLPMYSYEKVLRFWFQELTPSDWFKKDNVLDMTIMEYFESYYREIQAGNLEDWLEKPESTLAYILVLDQFARNMFRGTHEMFALDNLARKASHQLIDSGDIDLLSDGEKTFVYMPLMHSEELSDQNLCVELFQKLAEEKGG